MKGSFLKCVFWFVVNKNFCQFEQLMLLFWRHYLSCCQEAIRKRMGASGKVVFFYPPHWPGQEDSSATTHCVLAKCWNKHWGLSPCVRGIPSVCWWEFPDNSPPRPCFNSTERVWVWSRYKFLLMGKWRGFRNHRTSFHHSEARRAPRQAFRKKIKTQLITAVKKPLDQCFSTFLFFFFFSAKAHWFTSRRIPWRSTQHTWRDLTAHVRVAAPWLKNTAVRGWFWPLPDRLSRFSHPSPWKVSLSAHMRQQWINPLHYHD